MTCDEGDNVSPMMSNKGNEASLTTAEMPAHQQWQQHHRDESNNRHHDNSKDACTLTATMPSQ
jgi:hypothetical protein